MLVSINGTPVQVENGTLKIKEKSFNSYELSFSTYEEVAEWDEVTVRDDANNLLFAGIIEQPTITRIGGTTKIWDVQSRGYKKELDRKRVTKGYINETSGDVIKDIISTFTSNFTANANVEAGSTITRATFNYQLVSNALRRVADMNGFIFYVDNNKEVHFKAKKSLPAPFGISDSGSNFRKLKLEPDVSNFCTSVVVRGSTYLSTEVEYRELGDGEKTQFVLPEKPREVTVYVDTGAGFVQKTLAPKFGEGTPTTDFLLNYNEKYIENGTHAVLGSSHRIKILYKYDVPLLVRQENISAIETMKGILPHTDGVFEHLIEDKEIDSREEALGVAQEYLNAYSNTMISGSFETDDAGLHAGQTIDIDTSEFKGQAVIQSVTIKHVGGDRFVYSVQIATVLFEFEDFMRKLLTATRVEVLDGEVVENIYSLADTVAMDDAIVVSSDLNRQSDTIEFTSENVYMETNKTITYGLGTFFPPTPDYAIRNFLLDSSPLA